MFILNCSYIKLCKSCVFEGKWPLSFPFRLPMCIFPLLSLLTFTCSRPRKYTENPHGNSIMHRHTRKTLLTTFFKHRAAYRSESGGFTGLREEQNSGWRLDLRQSASASSRNCSFRMDNYHLYGANKHPVAAHARRRRGVPLASRCIFC